MKSPACFVTIVAAALIATLVPGKAQAVTITEYPVPTASSAPYIITSGPDGNLWFSESTNSISQIGKVTPDGVFTEYPVPTAFSSPTGIAAGPDGNLWFTEYNMNNIGRVTPAGVFTEYPTYSGDPWRITAGPDGNLWFTERSGNKIGKVTPAGVITEYSIPTGSSSFPVGITAGPDGNVWFIELTGNEIGKVTPAGVFTQYPIPTASSSSYEITAGPDGNLWFTESGGNKIGKVTPAGAFTEYPVPTFGSAPSGIAAGPDGNLWFTENSANKIGKVTPAGVFTEYPVPTAGSAPYGITLGPDGNLWFTEGSGNNIGRISDPSFLPTPTPTPSSTPPASPTTPPNTATATVLPNTSTPTPTNTPTNTTPTTPSPTPVSTPTTTQAAGVVGSGTAASCTDAALNTALSGGGLVTFNCGPGAVAIDISSAGGGTGTKTISADTTIDGGGLVTISGGNIVRVFYVNDGVRFTVQNLTIADGNSGFFGGGAIYNNGGAVTVTNSTFAGNSTANFGGAIFTGKYAGNSTLTVTNSTFSGNSAGAGGGAISNHYSGTVSVTNSTFSTNSGAAGGAIYNDSGTVTVTNTIVANSTSGGNCAGGITDGGHNIDDGTTCGFTGAGCTATTGTSFCNTNPVLDPAGLQYNGGPTQTIALCTGPGAPSAGCTGASPAINAGDESVCSTTTGTAPVDNLDQRGVVRPGAGAANCSIGAFEANSAGATTPTSTATAAPTDAPTSTPTPTPTNSPTWTLTYTPSLNATNTPTVANSPMPTNTPTATPTQRPSNTPTQTPTVMPTQTPTNTPTPAPISTPSATVTPSRTPTYVGTATATSTATAASNTSEGQNVTVSTTNNFTNSAGQTTVVQTDITFAHVTGGHCAEDATKTCTVETEDSDCPASQLCQEITTVTALAGPTGPLPAHFTLDAGQCSGNAKPCVTNADCPSRQTCKRFEAFTFDVATTAITPGGIQVCQHYADPDTNNTKGDLLTGTSINELSLAIFHKNAVTGQFVNVTLPGYPNPVQNMVCGSVTDLSPFVAGVDTNIPGGGPAKTDCLSEWNAGAGVAFSRAGLPKNRVVCKDGDSCDSDGMVNGQCRFSIDVCPNVTDARLPSCMPSDIARYTLAAPMATSPDATNRANAAAILGALAQLPMAAPLGKIVTYTPPLTATTCASGIVITVPHGAKRPGSKTLRLTAVSSSGAMDADTLTLVCQP